MEKSCVTFYILAYLSKCKEWLHFPDYSNKSLSIYLSNSHMNWIRRITRHGIYCLFTLLQVTESEQEEQLELGWAATSCTAHSTESVHRISTQYTLYTIITPSHTILQTSHPNEWTDPGQSLRPDCSVKSNETVSGDNSSLVEKISREKQSLLLVLTVSADSYISALRFVCWPANCTHLETGVRLHPGHFSCRQPRSVIDDLTSRLLFVKHQD